MEKNLQNFDSSGIEIDEVIETGSVVDHILHIIEKLQPDVVVMGTQGIHGMEETFIGSNTEKVVRSVNIPVITVKQPVKDPELKTIVFASDFSKEAEEVFPVIRDFATLFNAQIHLVKVNTPSLFETTRKSKDDIKRFLAAIGAGELPFTIYNDKRKDEGIILFADEIGADLIALGTHGREGLSRYFNHSLAEKLVNHAPLPVLTANIHKNKRTERVKAK
jgi:nucleotide-binding universal stress UspA family protein